MRGVSSITINFHRNNRHSSPKFPLSLPINTHASSHLSHHFSDIHQGVDITHFTHQRQISLFFQSNTQHVFRYATHILTNLEHSHLTNHTGANDLNIENTNIKTASGVSLDEDKKTLVGCVLDVSSITEHQESSRSLTRPSSSQADHR